MEKVQSATDPRLAKANKNKASVSTPGKEPAPASASASADKAAPAGAAAAKGAIKVPEAAATKAPPGTLGGAPMFLDKVSVSPEALAQTQRASAGAAEAAGDNEIYVTVVPISSTDQVSKLPDGDNILEAMGEHPTAIMQARMRTKNANDKLQNFIENRPQIAINYRARYSPPNGDMAAGSPAAKAAPVSRAPKSAARVTNAKRSGEMDQSQ